MKNRYTSERNIQILISLLKKHNIKNIIASPGTTNISFVASVQSDDFFNVISCVDERSAAYMACGMAAQTNEPVVLTCTGATASRNYVSALTEAFYRKLPIIALTASQHLSRVGQNIPQVIDRSSLQNDITKKSIQLTSVTNDDEAWACNFNVNNALLELKNNGGGPVHINMITTYSNDFSCDKLPDERLIQRISYNDELPKIKYNRVAIFIGNHKIISKEEEKIIDEFCEKYNAVVLCDHTSNYHGKYKILGNLVSVQSGIEISKNIDLLIDLGEVSGSYMEIRPKEVWRVNSDGIIRDTYKRLTYIFSMNEFDFFKKYNTIETKIKNTTYYEEWKKHDIAMRNSVDKLDLPFSNLWITKNTINRLKEGSIVHLAILNTLRSWNYFESKNKLNCYSNTGGFGIDGIMSTAVGASLSTKENVYCFIGDLAFFYDMNSIGNRMIPKNLRILLVNNGCGTEFHNYLHRAVTISKTNNLSLDYFAADGHFGNKSINLVKHYAEDLGFKYMNAIDKNTFMDNIEEFINGESDKPVIFEVFTNADDESDALKMVNRMRVSQTKSIARKILGPKGVEKVKKILKK